MYFRILTERKNKRAIASIVSASFAGFTMLEGVGYWKGRPELMMAIEIGTSEAEQVNKVGLAVKEHNKQQSVLVQQIPNHAWFI